MKKTVVKHFPKIFLESLHRSPAKFPKQFCLFSGVSVLSFRFGADHADTEHGGDFAVGSRLEAHSHFLLALS